MKLNSCILDRVLAHVFKTQHTFANFCLIKRKFKPTFWKLKLFKLEQFVFRFSEKASIYDFLRTYKYKEQHVWGAYDKFPDFFRMGTFIDSTHMKL